MRKTKNKYFCGRLRVALIIVLVLVLIVGISSVFAKYIHSNEGKNLLSAKEFYFTSNLLKENTAKYVLNSTATEISFTLGNNEDKLRFSQDDIKYEITVETNSGANAPTIVYDDTEQILYGTAVDTATVTLKNLVMGETYIVTATGRAGYKQVLKAEFTVSDKAENIYKYLDTSNSAYVLLTVWTENIDGTLTIKVEESGLVPDNTDPVLRNVYNYNNGEYGEMVITDSKNYTNTYSSYTYRFFVSGNGGYSADDFNVFIETHLAEGKTPQ